MKRLVIPVFLLLYFYPAFSQRSGSDIWKFYTMLSETADKLGTFDCEEIRLDQFDASIFSGARAKMTLPRKANWQIFHEYRIDWEHVMGQGTSVISSNEVNVQIPVIKECLSYNSPVYSSESLISGLGLRENTDVFLPGPLSQFPDIHRRDDPLNGVWTSIVAGDFLIIRHVSSYPDGNMTSFYRESRLYFRRVR